MIETPMNAAVDRAIPRAADPRDGTPLLTVIVPVYNEAETVSEQLARILASPYSKQVIVVDDGSTDGTPDALRAWQDDDRFTLLRHEVNRGVGAALRTALPHACGRFTIIQDADLEYDPEDYPRLIGPLLAGEARAVFGSRYMSETPHVPVWKRVANVVRAMKSRVRNAMQSVARDAMSALKWVLRVRATESGDHPSQTAGTAVQPMQAAGSQVPPAKRRSQRWSPRRLGAEGLKLAVRLLYGARLSDVAASPKAFSTDLLRNLDLQCERFEFGPEVMAKLCRAGEKIVEVPVHYEHRVARGSWLMERFARRPAAAADHGLGQRRVGKKHRWTDGPRALNTLWRWRHWTPQVPDPDRIPAVAPAASAQKAMAGETVSAALDADLDHWAKEDAKRSDFDEAVWNVPRGQRPAEASADGSVEAKVAASSSDARSEAFSSAAASFEPRLLWEQFVRKPTAKFSYESEESATDQDWEHWGLTDLLLLLAIVNIGLVLLVTMVDSFSSWSGLLLAVLVSAVTFRTTRAGKITFDKCNQAFALLAILLVSSMFPSSWVWRDRTMLVLAAVALLLGLARLRSKGIRQLERNLLDAIGVLAFFFAGLHVASPDWRAVELLVLLASVTLFIAVHRQRKMRRPSDNALLTLAAIGIFLAVVFSYLFPIDLLQLSWRESWLQFRYKVLPHWTEFWWFRWGIVAAIAAMVAALLLNRARREA